MVISFTIAALLIVPDINVQNINEILKRYPGIDKIVHFVEHLVLTVVTFIILRKLLPHRPTRTLLIFATLLSIAFSLLDEVHQLFVAGRSFEYFDLVANISGATTAVLLILWKQSNRGIALVSVTAPLILTGVVTYISHKEQLPYYQGMQFEKERQYELAKTHYLRAIKAGNDSTGLYNAIAWLNLEFLQRDYEEALNYAYMAVQDRPNNADYLDTYGWALYLTGQYNDSVQVLKKAKAINPNIFCINYHLAMAYLKINQIDKAKHFFFKQLALNENNEYAIRTRAELSRL
jgi:tetratricopeptide (TPR) repeat protein